MTERLYCNNCQEFQTFNKDYSIEKPGEIVIWEVCHKCQEPMTERRIEMDE